MAAIAFWTLMLAPPIAALLLARPCVHYFQLESYQFLGYARTVRRQRVRLFLPGLCASLVFAALLFVNMRFAAQQQVIYFVLFLACVIALYICLRAARKRQGKVKPLVWTARVKRLCSALFVLIGGLSALVCVFARGDARLVIALAPLFSPIFVALAAMLAYPIEKGIFLLYFLDARKRLAAQDGLIRIGITGSYGKTSVKFILATLLAEKYNVLATPASFNTTMGVTRVVRERLAPAHQVFIAEMGARHMHDIRELCKLVHPEIGVLTSVGPQHLETFKSIERIINTKYDLIEAIPQDGFCAFASDGDICDTLYAKTDKQKALSGKPGSDAWAEDVRVSPEGSAFTLFLKGQPPVVCKTRLLGEHSIQNICLAATVARRLGLSTRQIARGIEKLTPVEHRLQLLATRGGVTIIDDAFNANPRGSRAALRVLKAFAPARRIIVTPGMVELGAKEAEFNHAFGKEMASCADIALLVGGKHTAPIAKGLADAGFPQESVHVFANLSAAQGYLNSITRSGDVVLYENDLPDNYSEA